ncbi:MAG: methyltransferase [Candidatus Heimdallarchaeota archaeon]|nr:methyltransferase [Candidatus Heimdallarchaeota archaeon]MDH5646969.1 methyltransferase [Candidatus Heimdallarchaeota archaeon]
MDQYIESSGVRIYLSDNTYTPREDSFLMYDCILEYFTGTNQPIVEIGTGSGFTIIQVCSKWTNLTNIATDISLDACLLTLKNAKTNRIDNLHIVRTDLCLPFRKGDHLSTVIFNPPYLPADPDTDGMMSESELHQLVGGKKGYEIANRLVNIENLSGSQILIIISSLSTNPVQFAKFHNTRNVQVIRTLHLGFETIWILLIKVMT